MTSQVLQTAKTEVVGHVSFDYTLQAVVSMSAALERGAPFVYVFGLAHTKKV